MDKLLLVIFISVLLCGFTSYKSKSLLPEKLSGGKGEQIYLRNGCAECHGTKGKGNGALSEFLEPKPRNFTSLEEMKHLPDSLMMYSIKHGVMGSAMPKHGELKEEEINDLVTYLRLFLADYYHTVNMCVTDSHTVNLKETDPTYKTKVENPEKIVAEVLNGSLVIQATAPILLLNKMSKEKKRSTRSRVIIHKSSGDKSETILVTVRVHDCIRGKF